MFSCTAGASSFLPLHETIKAAPAKTNAAMTFFSKVDTFINSDEILRFALAHSE
jgi:hypothetical protein